MTLGLAVSVSVSLWLHTMLMLTALLLLSIVIELLSSPSFMVNCCRALYGMPCVRSVHWRRRVRGLIDGAMSTQSIYAWRGAQVEIMRRFRFDFEGAWVNELVSG